MMSNSWAGRMISRRNAGDCKWNLAICWTPTSIHLDIVEVRDSGETFWVIESEQDNVMLLAQTRGRCSLSYVAVVFGYLR